MIRLLFVTPARDSLAGLASALKNNDEVELSWAQSGGKALDMVVDTPVDLVVTDEFLGDMTGLELAERMLSVNPMINCAAVSKLSSKEFHEASEGLGLMAQLPAAPDKEQAEELLNRLIGIKRRVADV
jgi:CheY-like chemotaxis protein